MKPFVANDEIARQSYLVSRTVLRAVIERYSTIDALSTWTLGVTGLASGFLFTNLLILAKVIKPQGITWILACFVVSLVLGLLEKLLAIHLEYAAKVDEQVIRQLQVVIDTLVAGSGNETKGIQSNVSFQQLPERICKKVYDEIVQIVENAITELRTGLPWPFSYFTVRAIKASETDDILYGLKLAGHFFFAQLVLLTLQLLALIVALGGATCNRIYHPALQ